MSTENNFPSFTEAEKLEWIKTKEKLSEIRKGERGLRDKMVSKIKENPFVPVGILATTVALSLGLMAMKRGDKKRSQLMMRARIGAQAFTVTSILVGIVIAAGTKPTKT